MKFVWCDENVRILGMSHLYVAIAFLACVVAVAAQGLPPLIDRELMFGNFLLIIAQFGSSFRIRAFGDHRSNNQKSEFLLFAVVALEVFRLGTKAPPSLVRCGAA